MLLESYLKKTSCFKLGMLLILVLAVSLSCLGTSYMLDPNYIVSSINCGSTQPIRSFINFQFNGETGLAREDTLSSPKQGKTKYTYDPELFLSARVGEEFEYSLPSQTPEGDYVLVLMFAEKELRSPQSRVFSIRIGDTCLLAPSVDVFKEAGFDSALELFFEYAWKEGRAFYNGVDCRSNSIQFRAITGKAFVNGLILFKGSLFQAGAHKRPQEISDWVLFNENMTPPSGLGIQKESPLVFYFNELCSGVFSTYGAALATFFLVSFASVLLYDCIYL